MLDAANGQAWNAYAYGYNDVVNLIDPSGFAPGPLAGVTGFIDGIGGGISSMWNHFTNWWNKPICGCTAASSGQWISRVIGTLGGSAAISYKIQTFMRTQIQQTTTRSINYHIIRNQVIRGTDVYCDPTSGKLMRFHETEYSEPVTRVTESEVGAFDLRGAGRST